MFWEPVSKHRHPQGQHCEVPDGAHDRSVLLIAHGTAAEVAKAKEIIESTNPAHSTLHTAEPVAA